MSERTLYILIDAGVIALPFLFSFHPRIRFYRHWVSFFAACVVVLIPFIIWDIAFTQAGYWGFNERYLLGISLWHLPVEEWLFFICIPYACTFTFYCLGFLKFTSNVKWVNPVSALSGLSFLVIAFLHTSQAYTFLAYGLSGLTLLVVPLIIRPNWWPRALLTYLLILPFFFLSNGLLTGSWINEEVVWYNSAENLGVRLGTIPIEDTAYGMLLVLLNIMLFEFWRRSDKQLT